MWKPACIIVLYIASSAGNALTFKRMTDVYEGSEFFASQWNVFLYTSIALVIVFWKSVQDPRFLATQKKCFAGHEIVIMGLLDSVSSVLSCIGGANTAGGVQNVMNQTLIPMTLVMSFVCLGARYSVRQMLGAAIILAGALWCVSSAGGNDDASTTWSERGAATRALPRS